MKFIFTSQLQIASLSLFIYFKSRITSNGKLINVCFNSSAQRLMVKLHKSSDGPWSAIFRVIVYSTSSSSNCYMTKTEEGCKFSQSVPLLSVGESWVNRALMHLVWVNRALVNSNFQLDVGSFDLKCQFQF